MFSVLAVWAVTQLIGGEWVAPAGRLLLAVAGMVALCCIIAGLVRQDGEDLYGGAKYDPSRKWDDAAD